MNEFSATGERLGVPAPASRRRHQDELDEGALVRAAQQGSEQAMGDLVERHWGAAHRAAYLIVRDSHAAEDVTQEAMLAAAQAIHDFDRRRPLGPWIHRIVVNRSLDWLRSRNRLREAPHEEAFEPRDQGVDGALSSDLAIAMSSLEPEERAVIVLRHVLDYRSREIARLLGMRPATVRTRLRRALTRLRQGLEQQATERNEPGGAP